MLLPDQTYEQCQDMLAPLVALKRILDDTESKPQIEIEYGEKCTADGLRNDGHGCDVVDRTRTAVGETVGATPVDNAAEEDRYNGNETPESYERTSDFFNNIPEFNGEPLGPFSVPHARDSQQTSADLMRECELFLYRHRIRPDFFCRYRKVLQ